MSTLRVITEQQKVDGFLLKVGGVAIRQDYAIVGRHGDGTYLAVQPSAGDLVTPVFG